jgi:DNA-binding transcriptional LysR family regulator
MNNLLRKIDLTSLRLFVTVCQEKNIARAAEREFIAPSAVSRRITEIEAVIGLPVIERQSRGITVTPVGETVLRHAQAVIANIESMNAELSQFFSGAKGDVRVVANLSSMVQFLPEDVAAFQRLFPEVNIEIDEQNSPEVVQSVDERRADFGICIANTPGVEALECLPYRKDRLSVMVPRHHRIAGEAQIHFASLASENFVGLPGDSALTALLAQEGRRAGFEPRVKIRISSLDALCRMVHVGLGIAVLPHQAGELYLNTLDVDLVPLADPWAVRAMIIVCRARDQLNATANSLVGFLANEK